MQQIKRKQLERKLESINERLELYYEKEKALLSNEGVQSYTIGSRTISRYQYSTDIRKQIETLEKQRDEIELALAGIKPRKAMAVVPRDW